MTLRGELETFFFSHLYISSRGFAQCLRELYDCHRTTQPCHHIEINKKTDLDIVDVTTTPGRRQCACCLYSCLDMNFRNSFVVYSELTPNTKVHLSPNCAGSGPSGTIAAGAFFFLCRFLARYRRRKTLVTRHASCHERGRHRHVNMSAVIGPASAENVVFGAVKFNFWLSSRGRCRCEKCNPILQNKNKNKKASKGRILADLTCFLTAP